MPNTFTSTGSAYAAPGEAYASASDVVGLCRNLLGSNAGFSSSTSPTLVTVNSYLSSGCGILESVLASKGYAVPVATGTAARDWLRQLNALYAAGMSELTRVNVTLGPGERTRGQYFLDLFWKDIGRLSTIDLTPLGVGRSSATATLYVGGVSRANKDIYGQGSDYIQPRFKRGMFVTDGVMSPAANDDSAQWGDED